MADPLLKFYEKLEGHLHDALCRQGVSVSCRRGCAHCCHIMTAIHALEGRILAERVVSTGRAMEIAKRCQESAQKLMEFGTSRTSYFDAYIPCPLLDPEKQECLFYKARPAACRFYLVVSDPALCAPENKEPNVRVVNTSELQATAIKACMSVTNKVFIVAPVSLMVLFSLPRASKTEEDKAAFRELTKGLPDPVEWMKQNYERHDDWDKETTEEHKAAIEASFKKVFTH